MCGICGIVDLGGAGPPERELLARMVAALRHRGPDASGLYLDERAGLGHTRLSIIDLSTGDQPMADSAGLCQVVFNGEVFNYLELRDELAARGRHFRTTSDTEVLLAAYAEWGPACPERFIGDFAFAVWDPRERTLFAARDRMGVRPLYYAEAGGALLFASEIGALLRHPALTPRLSPRGVLESFLLWSPLAPQTAFEGIRELPPGHLLTVANGAVRTRPYWEPPWTPEEEIVDRPRAEYVEELRALLEDAVRLRLRADVPVGAYLSGGLDSSALTALMLAVGHRETETFSIAFESPIHDERAQQELVARSLGVRHHPLVCREADIAGAFPEAVRHDATPVLRTAGAPLYLLAGLVREHGLKVVLTGEGADEVLAGYDLFKEDKIRRFWARDPLSPTRPLLLQRLYSYFALSVGASQSYLQAFFGEGLSETDDPLYSHGPRFRTTRRNLLFLRPEFLDGIGAEDVLDDLRARLGPRLAPLGGLSRAQALESATLLPGYLLAAQGDRPMMAHGVEGRVPYLDHRIVEFAARVPARIRMPGLTEKWLLRQAVRDLLPHEIVARPKQPYMAPDSRCFVDADAPPYVADLLGDRRLAEYGLFEPRAVAALYAKCRARREVGFRDNMAFVGILSTQLLEHLLVRGATL